MEIPRYHWKAGPFVIGCVMDSRVKDNYYMVQYIFCIMKLSVHTNLFVYGDFCRLSLVKSTPVFSQKEIKDSAWCEREDRNGGLL